jgi:hypothetical protein
MICEACRERRHEKCRGGSWCDCQHHPSEAAPESGEKAKDDTEPRVNWLRQG